MSRQDLYTAMSRFTRQDLFGLDCSDCDRVFAVKIPKTEQRIHKMKPMSLLTGRIYRIHDKDNNEYIGMTTGTLEKRYQEHHDEPTSERMKAWLANTETAIELVCEVAYVYEDELRSVEMRYIARVAPEHSMNTQHKPKSISEEKQTCRFVTQEPGARKAPKIADDTKNKRYKVQQSADGKNVTRYFSYRTRSKAEAHAEAIEYVMTAE